MIVVVVAILITIAVVQVGLEIFGTDDYGAWGRRHHEELAHVAWSREVLEMESIFGKEWVMGPGSVKPVPRGLWCPVHRGWHPSPVCDPGDR
jgi:hypothetical protein